MPSNIEQLEALIVAQLKTVSYLAPNAGGTVRGVADIKTFLDLTTLEPPTAIVVFDGEKAGKDETIGRVTQQTTWYWTLYLVASSFGTDGEGRLGATGAYQMVDDVVAALEGFTLTIPPDSNTTKLIYIGAARFNVEDTAVIYEVRFRHQFLRQGP